jgi:hypothetical protein
MSAFQVYQLLRSAAPEIPGTLLAAMLGQAPLYIVCDSCVERIIRTEDDVDLPAHSAMIANNSVRHSNSLTGTRYTGLQ